MAESDAPGRTAQAVASPPTAPVGEARRLSPQRALADRRVIWLCLVSVVLGLAAGFVAQALVRLIGFFTNLSFYGRLSTAFVSPAGHHLGVWVVLVPTAGGLVVGLMARYGSPMIRGHGIPEAMEQVLLNRSRIPPRVTLLKPLSAAVAIGTGGPFGAEGPIIATGGALGSLIGQLLETTAVERKTLLAAGAAAGMAATFGSPVSAVLLAVELLLFELRPRSIVPVALASLTAAALRLSLVGARPIFAMPRVVPPSGGALAGYVLLGALVGVAAVLVTRLVYAMEDLFARLPLHWMWWPLLGGLAVGLVGLVVPATMGVGYDNIEAIVGGDLAGRALLALCIFKLVSWVVALASGTSGGTLAPLFTIGGAFGGLVGIAASRVLPALGIDPRVAALVGMAGIFAGASRALLASIVFAFETTLQPMTLLPLLGGCSAAFLVSCMLMRNTIMTEKIARRGVRVPAEYQADDLDQLSVGATCARAVVTLGVDDALEAVRAWLLSGSPGTQHQGFPVVDVQGRLVGLVSRRFILDPAQPGQGTVREIMRADPPVVFEDCSLREAADHMLQSGSGRLPVVARADAGRLVGLVTRTDLLAGHVLRLEDNRTPVRSLVLPRWKGSPVRLPTLQPPNRGR